MEEIKGIRFRIVDDAPAVEYHIKWKDGEPDTWEQASNLSDDLIRDYEERWWTAARKGDVETMAKMLAGGRQVLCQVRTLHNPCA